MSKAIRDTFLFSEAEMAKRVSPSLLRPYQKRLDTGGGISRIQSKIFCSKGGIQSVSKKVAISRQSSTMEYIGVSKIRRSGAGRPVKYGDLYKRIEEFIRCRRESGYPLNKEQLYLFFRRLIISWPDSDRKKEFKQTFLGESRKQYALRFLTRTISANGWSVRAKSISQSIPNDWKAKCISVSERIRESFRNVAFRM
jgi:hypothetical protein